MTVRALAVLSDGTITRTITADPAMIALNVSDGESLFQIVDDDGALVDDANIVVSETGALQLKPGAPSDFGLPGGSLELVLA